MVSSGAGCGSKLCHSLGSSLFFLISRFGRRLFMPRRWRLLPMLNVLIHRNPTLPRRALAAPSLLHAGSWRLRSRRTFVRMSFEAGHV